MRHALLPLILLGAVALAAGSEDTGTELGVDRQVRAVSLDLRGVVPTDEELLALEARGEVDEDTLDAWLASSAFEEQVVRQHRALLWNSLDGNLFGQGRTLNTRGSIYYNRFVGRWARGEVGASCTNRPASNAPGERVTDWVVGGDGNLDEGYVEVEPYWAMGTTIKVCAFEAQDALVSSHGTDCALDRGFRDLECGCGPNLQWCASGAVLSDLRSSMEEQVERQLRAVLRDGGGYDEVLTRTETWMNAPLAHYERHLAPLFGGQDASAPLGDLPTFDTWSTDDWRRVERYPEHAGILTSPGWLLRHQTNRGRANRFYGGFLCHEFLPQAGGIGGLEQGTPTPDLTLRTGCRDCHARLEPWAAYWGRFAEAGTAWRDAETFPRVDPTCEACARTGRGCSTTCRANYVVTRTHPDEEPYLGWYAPYAFLEGEQLEHPDVGPGAWVQEVVDDGSLATCTVRNVSRWLLGAPAQVDAATLQAWSASFQDSGMDYRELVRNVITSDAYRRVR